MESGRDTNDDTAPGTRGAILVLPTVTAGQQGPVAAWVSTAGWASGLRRLLGTVWIVTPGGVMDPTSCGAVVRKRRSPRKSVRDGSAGFRWSECGARVGAAG